MATATTHETVPVYDWLLADGTSQGLGTRAEFVHWTAKGALPEGSRLGEILGSEPAGEDDRRADAWATELHQ